MFGTLGQDLKPFRDPVAGGDLLFSQVDVDVWASFARTGNPNPDEGFLQARGHTSVIQALKQWGKWEAIGPDGGIKKGDKNLRILDVPSFNSGWLEEEQCALLGYPFNMFE